MKKTGKGVQRKLRKIAVTRSGGDATHHYVPKPSSSYKAKTDIGPCRSGTANKANVRR